ncbi:DJ-1/PfpI family protein [Lacisediminihabitans sp. H27-G8]|uniref:DJ-1/PfpI family protein n=1 Tax=Lacisediminihabitans sp. H27-G8 TaxID=3111909 RepID=UPI0038FD18D5
MSSVLRRLGTIALSATIALVAFAATAAAGIAHSSQSSTSKVAGTPSAHQPIPRSAKARFTVAVVLGQSGSDAADVLAPYEVLASSPDFAVYTIAASTKPAALDGGMAVDPDYTFADVASGAAPAPDLIVVPAVNLPDGPEEQAARDFVVERYGAGARILGICAGSRLLSATGILNGLTATSHWSRIAALEKSNPEVSWIRGQRYVQDGRVTTTGGVTSSISGALKVMADMVGSAEAKRVGGEIAYPGWTLSSTTRIPKASFGLADAAVLLNTAFPWGRPSFTIELTDGVGEIDASALFEVYSYSQSALTRAVSSTGSVRTKHGLMLRTELKRDAGGQTLVAGDLESSSGFGGLDAAFEQLGRSVSPALVVSVGKMLEYPLDRVTRASSQTTDQWRAPALLGLAVLLAAGLGTLPLLARRLRRRK